MPTIVRLAREEDILSLEDLFFRFSDWKLERNTILRKTINDDNGEMLVAECDGEIVGFLHQVFFVDPLHAGVNSDITSLFVKEGYRRRGIASQLLQKAIQNAKKRKVREIHVTTREDNNTAIRFYEKLGFKKEGILFETNP